MTYFISYLFCGLLFQWIVDFGLKEAGLRWSLGMFIIAVFFWPVPFFLSVIRFFQKHSK